MKCEITNPLKLRPQVLIVTLTLAALFLLPACGYHLVGTGSSLPSHVKTLAIPVFKNTSSEPQLQRDLTNAVRQAFISDGRLKVVSKNKQGHLLMKGTLESYELRPVSFNSDDVAIENWVILGVKILVEDQVKEQKYLNQKFITKWDYLAPENVTLAEANRREALQEAYRDFAIRLVSAVIDKF